MTPSDDELTMMMMVVLLLLLLMMMVIIITCMSKHTLETMDLFEIELRGRRLLESKEVLNKHHPRSPIQRLKKTYIDNAYKCQRHIIIR